MITRVLIARCQAISLAAVLAAAPAAAEQVAALAHIQPLNGVIVIDGPPGDSVAEVQVKEGQKVKAGDMLMVLQSAPGARAEVALAETTLKELHEQQPLELGQLQVEVRQADADLAYATSRLARYTEAGTAKIAPQLYDDQANQAATAKITSEVKHLRLTALGLQDATALSRAEAQLASAKATLDNSGVRAPTDGTILEIMTRPGESTGSRPIVRIADLDKMCVVADVFEGDLHRVRVGAPASISSKSMSKSVEGHVVQVGRIITGEGKIGKVKILADDPVPLTGLIDAEVDVLIND